MQMMIDIKTVTTGIMTSGIVLMIIMTNLQYNWSERRGKRKLLLPLLLSVVFLPQCHFRCVIYFPHMIILFSHLLLHLPCAQLFLQHLAHWYPLHLLFTLALSPLSWLQTNTSFGRPSFLLALCQLKGLVSCKASPFECSILRVGGLAPSPSFWTSLLRPRILLCLTPVLMSSPSHHWMTLLEAIGMTSCSALLDPLGNICPEWSSIFPASRVSSFPLV